MSFVMIARAASLGKEAGKKRKLRLWRVQGTGELATPLWVLGSEVITQI